MMRVGLGCMRLSTDAGRDEARALQTLRAALEAGIRCFDTARAYGLDETELGHNERLLARALAGAEATVITKGGMARAGRSWRPDGRALALRADAEASAAALGRPLDVYLVHAPDPRVAWATTVRELGRLAGRGLVREVGVSNVTLAQLERALDLAPVRWVQNPLSVLDDGALRSGLLARCAELYVRFLAHSPLGGPKQVERLLRQRVLVAAAAERGVSAAVLALAAVLDLAPIVTVLPGARRPETARDAARAGALVLDEALRARLQAAFPALRPLSARGASARRSQPTPARGELVLLMGLQGAGKTALAEQWVARGYARLNRDELGTTLEKVARRAQTLIEEGATHLVLDNTYLTRTARASIIDVAGAAGLEVRGVWLDVPLHEAQVNVIWRMLERHGRLLAPGELKRGKDNTYLPPLAQLRMVKELELPTLDEGFTHLEVRPFVRRPWPGRGASFAAEGLEVPGAVTFAWRPARDDDAGRGVLVCPHEGGPPVCWCRPPLPGLLLAYAFEHGVNLADSEVHGSTETHAALAAVLGARFVRHGG